MSVVRLYITQGRPTSRATDAAGAALSWARLFGVVVCFHVSSSRRRRAADADVGRFCAVYLQHM